MDSKMDLEIIGEGEIKDSMWAPGFYSWVNGGTTY